MSVCTCAGRVLERGSHTAEATADARALCVSSAKAALPEAIPNRIGCSRARIRCDCRLVSWLVCTRCRQTRMQRLSPSQYVLRPTGPQRCAANERTNERIKTAPAWLSHRPPTSVPTVWPSTRPPTVNPAGSAAPTAYAVAPMQCNATRRTAAYAQTYVRTCGATGCTHSAVCVGIPCSISITSVAAVIHGASCMAHVEGCNYTLRCSILAALHCVCVGCCGRVCLYVCCTFQ